MPPCCRDRCIRCEDQEVADPRGSSQSIEIEHAEPVFIPKHLFDLGIGKLPHEKRQGRGSTRRMREGAIEEQEQLFARQSGGRERYSLEAEFVGKAINEYFVRDPVEE